MPLKFRVIGRAEPGVAGGGNKKYYASPVVDGEFNMNELIRSIEKSCTVTGADIRAVLYALTEVSIEQLAKGSIVRLGELGSLRMSLSSEGKPTAKQVTASAIRGTNVIFTPGVRIKEMQSTLKFHKKKS